MTGDLVIIISDSHNDAKALMTQVQNVTVGCVAEFDESIGFPVEITFKEGDGDAPIVKPDDPVVEENPSVDGQLHVGAYNNGVWTENIYTKAALIYSDDSIDKKSTYIHYYVIKLNYDDATSKYKIAELKTIDVVCDFTESCDLYVLIYRDSDGKTYFTNAKVGGLVTINGDYTSGSCNLLFE